MIKSKTKIETQLKKKTSPTLVLTTILAKKEKAWKEVASLLTRTRRKRQEVNLTQIANVQGDVVVCGKVLSQGEVIEKKRVIALNFSAKAKQKLEKNGCQTVLLMDEIKNNKEAKGITILNEKKDINKK